MTYCVFHVIELSGVSLSQSVALIVYDSKMCMGKVLVTLTLRLGGHTEAEKKSLPYLCPERDGVWQRDMGNEDSGYEKTKRTERIG